MIEIQRSFDGSKPKFEKLLEKQNFFKLNLN